MKPYYRHDLESAFGIALIVIGVAFVAGMIGLFTLI